MDPKTTRTLRELREARHWSPQEAANAVTHDPSNRVGLSAQDVTAFEVGIVVPRIDQIEALASIYDVDPFTVDLGSYDRLGQSSRGHVYLMHLHRSEGSGYIARFNGVKPNPNGPRLSTLAIGQLYDDATAHRYIGETTEEAFTALATAVEYAVTQPPDRP